MQSKFAMQSLNCKFSGCTGLYSSNWLQKREAGIKKYGRTARNGGPAIDSMPIFDAAVGNAYELAYDSRTRDQTMPDVRGLSIV